MVGGVEGVGKVERMTESRALSDMCRFGDEEPERIVSGWTGGSSEMMDALMLCRMVSMASACVGVRRTASREVKRRESVSLDIFDRVVS